ncbi:hypothetical protein IWX90DRAFT_508254 [Phyllosticta citrichinensis]|uniref:Uncharacterized protein n=1 Tax=Phyllosticta citrichinensis TaxID=1130410 RepID=A0ABR1XLD6_9PEZI
MEEKPVEEFKGPPSRQPGPVRDVGQSHQRTQREECLSTVLEADSPANEALDKREKGIRETNRQAEIFVLCLGEAPLFDEMYAGFWNTLEDYAQDHQETDARSALDYLGAHRPDKILVVDPEVANKRKHPALLSKLKEYVSRGGTVIFCCIFSSFISPPELTAFFRTHFEIPWESGSYTDCPHQPDCSSKRTLTSTPSDIVKSKGTAPEERSARSQAT